MGLFDRLRGLLGEEPRATHQSAQSDDGGDRFRIPANATPDERVPFGAMAAKSRRELRENAEEFAKFWSEYEPDFTPSSIPGVDRMFAQQQDRANYLTIDLGDGYQGAVAPMASEPACYFGETMIRNYDADWTFDEDFGWALQFGGGQIVNIFKTAHQALDDDPPFVMLHDTFVEELELDGDLLDTEGDRADVRAVDEGIDPEHFDDEAIDASAAERSPTEVIGGVLEDAQDHVDAWPAYDFDYSVASLERLDEFVDAELTGPEFADAEIGSTDDEASIRLTAHTVNAGAYFGEVLRRTIGGSWHHSEAEGLRLELPGSSAATRISPIAIAESCVGGEDTFVDRHIQIHKVLAEVESRLDGQ